jgi:hypothetical protein
MLFAGERGGVLGPEALRRAATGGVPVHVFVLLY